MTGERIFTRIPVNRGDVIIDIPYLAQAVMAILFRRPDTARGRPSSLLKTDDDYDKVFNPKYPVHVYYVCVQAMRKVERAIKSNDLNVPRKDRSNLRFYVGMHAVAGTAKQHPQASDIEKFDPDNLDDAAVQKSLNIVQKLYGALGATDQIAKGKQLLDDILNYSETDRILEVETVSTDGKQVVDCL